MTPKSTSGCIIFPRLLSSMRWSCRNIHTKSVYASKKVLISQRIILLLAYLVFLTFLLSQFSPSTYYFLTSSVFIFFFASFYYRQIMKFFRGQEIRLLEQIICCRVLLNCLQNLTRSQISSCDGRLILSMNNVWGISKLLLSTRSIPLTFLGTRACSLYFVARAFQAFFLTIICSCKGLGEESSFPSIFITFYYPNTDKFLKFCWSQPAPISPTKVSIIFCQICSAAISQKAFWQLHPSILLSMSSWQLILQLLSSNSQNCSRLATHRASKLLVKWVLNSQQICWLQEFLWVSLNGCTNCSTTSSIFCILGLVSVGFFFFKSIRMTLLLCLNISQMLSIAFIDVLVGWRLSYPPIYNQCSHITRQQNYAGSLSELILILGVQPSDLWFLAFGNEFTPFGRHVLQVLTIHIQFASLVSDIVVFYILVLFLLLWFGHISCLLEVLITGPTVPSQSKFSIGTHLFDHQLALLLQHCTPSLHVHLENVQKDLSVFSDRPAHHHLHGLIDLQALGPCVHYEEVVKQVLQFFEIFIRFPEISLKDQERLSIEGYFHAPYQFFNGSSVQQSQLNHIQNFVFIGAADYNVVGSFFAVGAKHEQRCFCFLAQQFQFVSVLERVNVMLSSIHC